MACNIKACHKHFRRFLYECLLFAISFRASREGAAAYSRYQGMNMNFDAIIFDCDGVLVDSEVLAIRGERDVLGVMGLHYSPQEYVRNFVGLHDNAFFSRLRDDYEERLGKKAPDDFDEQVLSGRRRERHLLEPVKNADVALRVARKTFSNLGVASSSRAHFLRSKLERTGLDGLAGAHVYSADLVAHGKPAPDIFLYTAEKMDVDPARCLVLEDSENGARAGVAAGMAVWGFLGGGHVFDGHAERLLAAGAVRNVDDFSQFITCLDAAPENTPASPA